MAVVGCLLSVVLGATAGGLDVARQALRDGLWTVARAHADKVSGDAAATNAARLVVLESLVGEGLWDKVLPQLKAWGEPTGDSFAYYRAAASGDYAGAVKLLRKSGDLQASAEARMLEADLLLKSGDRKGATAAWREVVAMTNVAERAFVTACANLMEAELLRKAYATAKALPLKHLAGLRLGMALLQNGKTAAEGTRLIRAIVKDSPDVEGARDAFLAIADADIAAARWQDAADVYREAIETWPDVVRRASVQDGIGWAQLKLGRREAALEAFRAAAKLADGDDERATAIMKEGDVLSEMGRTEEAMACYRDVLKRFPKTAVAEKLQRIVRLREIETSGREAFRGYRFSDAQKAFAEVAAEDPVRKPMMDYFDVLCLYGQGLDEAAEKKAQELADGCPDAGTRASAVLWLAKFSYNRGEWKKARRLFDAYAATAGADSAEALLWSARAALVENDCPAAIQTVTQLAERYPKSPLLSQALLVQGEALIEMARFDEAVLVFERVAIAEGIAADLRLKAQGLKADALFAMGADNPARYAAALEAYRAIRFGGELGASGQVVFSFKIARTLEKLKRMDEAVEQYYTQVVLAYRDGRLAGERYDDEARTAFSRAAFRLADEYEGRGQELQTIRVLELVSESDVPAAAEAARRLERISKKGRFL